MVTKIIVFLLMFSILFLLKEGYVFYHSFKIGKKDMTNARLFGIGAALSFVLTIIFTGICI